MRPTTSEANLGEAELTITNKQKSGGERGGSLTPPKSNNCFDCSEGAINII